MTETIMFNFDTDARNSWRNALSKSRTACPGTVDDWYKDLAETYGIKPVLIETGIAGVRIIDPDKFVLFRMLMI
jgi:hypothetical protein